MCSDDALEDTTDQYIFYMAGGLSFARTVRDIHVVRCIADGLKSPH